MTLVFCILYAYFVCVHEHATYTCAGTPRFIDGATYMAGVADALETAKEDIFITDWW